MKYKKWDQLLDSEDKVEWVKILKDIQLLGDIYVPRHCIDGPFPYDDAPGLYSLICFCDASQNAMCSAIYVKFESPTGNIRVGLLTAKTRGSPAKVITIPKLELCASLMGSRLVKKVTTSLSFVIDTIYFLIDSKIVLGDLNKGSLETDLVSNCVAEIRSNLERATFAWVPSEENIADLGSRGTSPDKVNEKSEWHNGPHWLKESVESWPIEIYPLDDLPEICCVQGLEDIIQLDKFSDLHKLHKHTAICIKFARSKGNGKKKLDNEWNRIKITPAEYEAAERYWVKKVSESVVQLYQAGKLDSLRASSVWDEKGNFLKIVTSGRLGKLLKIGYDL